MTACRICASRAVRNLGTVAFYRDYAVPVYDCDGCGCRWVEHDAGIHDSLHADDGVYAWHAERQRDVQAFFAAGDGPGLASYLCARDIRVRFIVEKLAALPQGARVLEVGCSRGYLTALLLSQGYAVTGTDISPVALAAAAEVFGNHFCLPDDPAIAGGAPYDAIVHAGTIGCVDQPIRLTRYWLSMLRPGGVLVFNAPNRAPCDVLGTPWVSGTTPPDLVTLFPADFWSQMFRDEADVTTHVIEADPATAWVHARLAPRLLRSRSCLFRRAPMHDALLVLRRKALYVASRVAMTFQAPSRLPAEFGVFVCMCRRSGP